MKLNRRKGNITALIVGLVLLIGLLIAFFALNLGQLFGSHQEAQTAIDAAALTAARDIGRITIDDPRFGRVALVDDLPPGQNPRERPVWGINTLLATARLDFIIAEQLGNVAMTAMAVDDMISVRSAGERLRTEILAAGNDGKIAKDKEGKATIDLRGNTIAAYRAHEQRLGHQVPEQTQETLSVTVGFLTPGAGRCNIPLPRINDTKQTDESAPVGNPAKTVSLNDQARDENGTKYYVPYTNYSTGSLPTMSLAAVDDEPKLVDNQRFVEFSAASSASIPAEAIPAVVRVEIDEQVTQQAPDGQAPATSKRTVHVAACAQTGGTRITHPSSSMSLEFPQGFPPPSAPISASTAQSIMNAADFGQGQKPQDFKFNIANLPASSGAWNGTNGVGQYGYALNGPLPRSSSGQRGTLLVANSPNFNSSLLPTGSKNGIFRGRNRDNPSVCLSFFAYDWMRSLGLRPQIGAMVAVLQTNLRSRLQSAPTDAYFFPTASNGFVPPAFAQNATGDGQTDLPVAMLNDQPVVDMANGASTHPQDWANISPDNFDAQFATANGYVPTGEVAGDVPNSILVGITGMGGDTDEPFQAVPVNGDPGVTLDDQTKHISECIGTPEKGYGMVGVGAKMLQIAEEAQGLVNQKLAEKQGQIDAKQKEIDDLDKNSPTYQDDLTAKQNEKTALEDEKKGLENGKAKQNADNAMAIARKSINTAAHIQTNLGAATAAGYQDDGKPYYINFNGLVVTAPLPYRLDDGVPGPAINLPTAQQIMESDGSDEACKIQQAPGAPGAPFYWTGDPSKPVFASSDGSTNVVAKRHPGDHGGSDSFFQPALAQTATNSFSGYTLIFNVLGDASQPEKGGVQQGGRMRMVAANSSPFLGQALQKGQVGFQALNAMRVLPSQSGGSSNIPIDWSVIAYDNNAYNDASSDFYANDQAPGNFGSDPIQGPIPTPSGNINPVPNKDYCQQGDLKFTLFPKFGPGAALAQSQGSVCPASVAKWQLNNPTPVCTGIPYCCIQVFNVSSTGGTVSAVASSCPPPPPRGH